VDDGGDFEAVRVAAALVPRLLVRSGGSPLAQVLPDLLEGRQVQLHRSDRRAPMQPARTHAPHAPHTHRRTHMQTHTTYVHKCYQLILARSPAHTHGR
jgi:hypothetical protein